ncbi:MULTISPECIES: VCBS repeat-containing protein [unclassified Streptomyces]|uniref:FG-GAP repeat domain-containing protein n=1 Tax=unclassified Streptomyces TaxID=2593676 RepID=UPI002D219BD3|nr:MULTISPECIES: VCBS repeat-containing protein [unclassified Streptomyces]
MRGHTSLGKGWNQYDMVTSPGDVSGDGRPDLIARNSSTGAVYLCKGTSSGKLSSRVKLYDNWKTYKKIVGVGDLNGDGKAASSPATPPATCGATTATARARSAHARRSPRGGRRTRACVLRLRRNTRGNLSIRS